LENETRALARQGKHQEGKGSEAIPKKDGTLGGHKKKHKIEIEKNLQRKRATRINQTMWALPIPKN